MRAIKFRAWDKQSQDWMYAGLKNGIRSFPLTVSNPLSLCLDDRFGDKYENTVWCLSDDELIWCQFTGLLDKNGTEVYEGDIIVDSLNFEYTIFYDTDEARFGALCNNKTYDLNKNEIVNTKIIGNRYKWAKGKIR